MDNIFEEFYGPSMESEISGQEGLGASIIAGLATTAFLYAGYKWVFGKSKDKMLEKTVNSDSSGKQRVLNLTDTELLRKSINLYSKPKSGENSFKEYIKLRNKVISDLNKDYKDDLIKDFNFLYLIKYISGNNLLDIVLTPEYSESELWEEVLKSGLAENKVMISAIDKIKVFPNIKNLEHFDKEILSKIYIEVGKVHSGEFAVKIGYIGGSSLVIPESEANNPNIKRMGEFVKFVISKIKDPRANMVFGKDGLLKTLTELFCTHLKDEIEIMMDIDIARDFYSDMNKLVANKDNFKEVNICKMTQMSYNKDDIFLCIPLTVWNSDSVEND